MATRKVLIVDDDIEEFDMKSVIETGEIPGYMGYYMFYLHEAGFIVETARGPCEALECVKRISEGDKAIVIIDVLMPPEGHFLQDDPEQDGVHTGLLLVDRIRGQELIPRSIPIVIFSNNAPPDAQGKITANCQKLINEKKVSRVLFKPDTLPSMLVDEVRRLFDQLS